MSLVVAQEQKLFLTLELKYSLGILGLFPNTLAAGPDISTFFSQIRFVLNLESDIEIPIENSIKLTLENSKIMVLRDQN